MGVGLSGRVVVVTGAASGIGRATARALAAAGARVAACDVDEVGLASLDAEVGLALWRRVDVSDAAAVSGFAAEVESVGPCAVVVNNAGIGVAGAVCDTAPEDLERVVRVNVLGVMYGCRAFGPAMRARGEGQIVNVASALGFVPGRGVAAYSASKAAVLSFSQALRVELAPHGVGVSVVCPGLIDTAIAARTSFSGDRAEAKRESAIAAFRRGHPPEGVAAAILSAIRWNRAIVPVRPESWGAWVAGRISPMGATWLTAWSAVGRAAT